MRTNRTASTPESASVARLTADLTEMREDRDRWRAQAERLMVALERLRLPAPAVSDVPAAKGVGSGDTLYGVAAIAAFLGMPEKPCRHRVEKGEIPTFKIGAIRCALGSDLNSWLATRAAAAQEGR